MRGRSVRHVGITRFTTKVTLTAGTAATSTGAAVVGQPVWTVDYTIEQRGREKKFKVDDYSEPGARRLVANLLANLKPGLRADDVYTEHLS